VYFGTGRYFSTEDVPGSAGANSFASQTQTFYGIVDDTSVASPTMPNVRGTNGSSCPDGGGNGDLVCQAATRASPSEPYTATAHAVDLSIKRGFYMDIPIDGGRVNTQAALSTKGTLVFVVNKPSNVVCNPGGSSYFFQLNAATGGAVPRTAGGNTFYPAGFALADALSSRPVLITTSSGTRALFRLSDKTTQSREINETGDSAAAFKRVYKRPLN
jgi:type IV pilus assembly protein PilY1